jgi:hypothetical protein
MLMKRMVVALLFLPAALLTQFAGEGDLGFSVEGTDQRSQVSAASDPVLIAISLLSLALMALLLARQAPNEVEGIPTWRRRFAAFVVDIYIVFGATTPLVAVISLAVEARRTGSFAWSFERDFTVASDWYVGLPLTLALVGMVALYFALPIVYGTQTVGCYLLRLKVAPVDPSFKPRLADALHRVCVAFFALCTLPITLIRGHGVDGSTWYDRSTRYRVNLVRYK